MTSRLQILDALRGLAALMVALFHFTNDMPASGLTAACSYGWLGVQIFFVISGFIIPYALIKARYQFPGDYGRFLLKRAVRLHPPFLASVALVTILWHLSTLAPGFQGNTPNYSALQLALHVPLLNEICGLSWMQPVYWTLAIEFQYYLLIGVLLPLLIRGNSPFWMVAITLLACSLIPRPSPLSNMWLWPFFPLFVLGILTCFHFQKKISTPAFLSATILSVVVGGFSLTWPEAIMGGLTALAIAFIQVPLPRALIWLGSISYSVYLLHIPLGGRVINLTKRLGHETLAMQTGCTLAAVALSLVTAWLFFRWVEIPAQRLCSSLWYRLQRTAPSISAP